LVQNVSSSRSSAAGADRLNRRAASESGRFGRELASLSSRGGRSDSRSTLIRSSRKETVADAPAQTPAASGLAVSVAPNPFNPAGGIVTAPAARTSLASPAAPAAETDLTPVERLVKQLDAMGISSAGLNLSESRTIVSYPGGAYVNHLITADFGNGVTERYDVGLMLKNPWLTAFEIGRLQRTLG
jgi:hypothetical protein